MYDFGGSIGPHPAVVISRNTNRSTVMVALITSTQHMAVDVVDLAPFLSDRSPLRGYVRCDQIATVERNDSYWQRFIYHLPDPAMEAIGQAIKAAFGLVT